ncbi:MULTISPECIES: YutD family protein [Bhargavaea]|uniref:YutD family protein n=1 Tax=Bhargavaea changchunensis TaxID=2134037 RepID=A0ABW2NIV0_9BACL|nr:YutD family protein [Bhargavaea sp. CC-171006]
MIKIENTEYEVVRDYRDALQEEALESRYSDILTKYDYIVGDWGYGQLRLRGFFDDKNPKATIATKISTLEDYLYEHCNFGCAYFVLKKISKPKGNSKKQGAQQEMEQDDPQNGE